MHVYKTKAGPSLNIWKVPAPRKTHDRSYNGNKQQFPFRKLKEIMKANWLSFISGIKSLKWEKQFRHFPQI